MYLLEKGLKLDNRGKDPLAVIHLMEMNRGKKKNE